MARINNIISKENSVDFSFCMPFNSNTGRRNSSEISDIISHTYRGVEVKWRVVLYPKKNGNSVAVYSKLISPEYVDKPRIFRFAILDSKKNEVNVKSTKAHQCRKTDNKLYGFRDFIARDEILGVKRNDYIKGNMLQISCQIIVCTTHPNAFSRLSKDFGNMVNGKFSDVEFTFGEQKITAHKCILGARSTVFDAMFEHDFEEKKSNSVAITDISYETFLNMINYIYTEKWVELTHEAKIKLLVAADKYDLKNLKEICAGSIVKMLLIENCLQTLVMADLHNCVKLKQKSMEFAKINFKQIILSDDWFEFGQSNPKIANEVLEFVLPDGKR